MARKTLSQTRKSRWIGDDKKRTQKPIKPIWPLQTGIIKCAECGQTSTVSAYAERIVEYPEDKFWVVTTCSAKVKTEKNEVTCGYDLVGWAKIVQVD